MIPLQSLPLKNVRILDMTRLLPGPFATQILADMGAEVIKIETPLLGDYARLASESFGGNGIFHLINRGKKSLGINYRNRRGREIFLDLAERSDVIVETFKPGSVDKWGIGYNAVRERNPAIVYCSLSGYGQDGPYRRRPGHDINYIAVGGLLDVNGPVNGAPVPPGVQIADLSGAMYAAVAVLGALLERQRSGTGAYLDISMLDAVIQWMMPISGGWLSNTGRNPERNSLPLTGGWPCNNVYETAEGRFITIGCLEPPFWGTFCERVDRKDWISRAFDPEIQPDVAAKFKEKTIEEWMALFADGIVPIEPVNTLEEAFQHPQVVHRGLARNFDFSGETPPQMGSPLPFPPAEGAAPDLGQDTVQLLHEIGISQAEIEERVERKVLNTGQPPNIPNAFQ
jgi:crotonobetainyl-CoA:carnitine CoA-transferase CaiB-like acyl-CoA transferase